MNKPSNPTNPLPPTVRRHIDDPADPALDGACGECYGGLKTGMQKFSPNDRVNKPLCIAFRLVNVIDASVTSPAIDWAYEVLESNHARS
jgi:hypothetical protein